MESKGITDIAMRFVEELNRKKPIDPDYEYSFDRIPKEFLNCWYFDFRVVCKKEVQDIEIESFGGAPGFIIMKNDKKIKTISFNEKLALEQA